MKILVTGASGPAGAITLKHLIEKGYDAVGAGRKAVADKPWVVLDYAKPTTFRKALKGVTHLFLVVPSGAKNPEYYQQFIDAALEVEHITFLSGRTTGDIKGRVLNTVEEQVRNCGLPYTILRPGWFMQNFSDGELARDIREEGMIYLPSGDRKTAFVDVRDIAEAVEQTFLEASHIGKTYELVSAEAIDHHQVANLFSRALDKSVEYLDISPADFTTLMLERGWDEKGIAAYIYLYDIVKTGKEEHLSPDLAMILGREPRGFAEFIADHLEVWR